MEDWSYIFRFNSDERNKIIKGLMIDKTNELRINYLSFYGLGILILLLSLRDMDIFHQNCKDKDIFFKSGGNFKDWGYSDPPYTPPLKVNRALVIHSIY